MPNEKKAGPKVSIAASVEPFLQKRIVSLLFGYPVAAASLLFSAAGVLKSQVLVTIVTILSVIYYLVLLVTSLGYAVRWRVAADRKRRTIAKLEESRRRFADVLARKHRDNPTYYYHDWWREILVVEKDGDTIIRRELKVDAGKDGTDIIFLNLYGNKPPKRRHGGRVTFKAQIGDANGGHLVNADFDDYWESDTKHSVFVYLNQRLNAGDSVTVFAEWKWPGYTADLMGGKTERHTMHMTRACSVFTTTLQLRKEAALKVAIPRVEGLKEAAPDITRTCVPSLGSNGEYHEIKFALDNLAANETFGIIVSVENNK